MEPESGGDRKGYIRAPGYVVAAFRAVLVVLGGGVTVWLFWTFAAKGASNSPDAAGAGLILVAGGVLAVLGAALFFGGVVIVKWPPLTVREGGPYGGDGR